MPNQTKTIFIVSLGFLLCYLFGFLFPNYWWSTHFIKFISPIFQLGFLLACCWFLFKIIQKESVNKSKIILRINKRSSAYITIGFVVLMFLFPMVYDFYGDAYKFNKFLAVIPSKIPEGTHNKFFSFSLSAWAGEGTVLAMVTYIAYYFTVSYKFAFLIINALFGGLFVFTWLYFINAFIKVNLWKVILAIAGLTAPFMLLFFGHIEIYAPIIFVNLVLPILVLLYLKTEHKKLLVTLVFVLVVSLKLHATAILYFPVIVLLFWKLYKGYYPNWKQVFKCVVFPLFLIGAVLYFFYFEDHIDGRSLQTTSMAYDHIFLPLFSPEAPLNNYNLLGFNHFFDYFSLLFLWSPIAVLLFINFFILMREKINWNTPEVVILGTLLILYCSFFFVLNPLLSMPIDWDLFSIPAPLLLVFVAVLTQQIEKENVSKKIMYAVGIVTILSLPVFLVHQSETSLSNRLESVAARIFPTYYEWTAKTVDNAYSLGNLKTNRLYRGDVFLAKLKPLAQKGIDYEYASLLIDQGRYIMREVTNYEKALEYFKLAEEYAPANNAKLLSLEAYFYLSQYSNAYQVSKELVELQFPSPQKALKINLHCALEVKAYKAAYLVCETFLKNNPSDKVVNQVYSRLSNNDRIDELKFLFKNPNRK